MKVEDAVQKVEPVGEFELKGIRAPLRLTKLLLWPQKFEAMKRR